MYKFIFEEDLHNQPAKYPRLVEMHFEDNSSWDELLQGFVQFLKGNGFYLPISAEGTIIDADTGEDLSLKVRYFKNEYLTEENDDEDSAA